ncbi:hypothetical protein [Nonomuraea typhae]|uniref:hypothetical protein n=1 Tax=Nonomuraea typhae TaxID=2603600 RepID=UPI0012FCD77E|nr:hypothetical protein [Nonomuraea typhae]
MPTLAERFIPAPDASERHAIVIAAPPERVWEAVRQPASARDIPLIKPLFAARDLVSRLVNGHAQRDLPAFAPLAEEPGREVVLGTVGQWWRLGAAESLAVGSAREFEDFDRPGFAKATFSFLLQEAGAGRVRLVTETRVAATSPEARRAFLRYWRVIRLGSGLVRRVILATVKARVATKT